MVAKHKIDGQTERILHLRKETRHRIRFADVSTQQERVEILLKKAFVEDLAVLKRNTVEVDIGEPTETQINSIRASADKPTSKLRSAGQVPAEHAQTGE